MSVTFLVGDVIAMLRTLPDDHFDCVVTSPPYWGLRDYGVPGQLGLEPTLGEHLAVMVAVFREVRRVLKPTGTCWVNYGDCYATTPNGRSAADTKAVGNDDRTFRDKPFSTIGGALKAKDLCMVPNRLAIALQEDGWWVRSEIIWAKPNPMPESVYDRPATAHEKIFLLSKAPRYFYDREAVRQGLRPSSISRLAQNVDAQAGSTRANGGRKTNGPMKAVGGAPSKQSAIAASAASVGGSSGRRMAGFNERWDAKEKGQYCKPYTGQSLKDYAQAGVQDPSEVKRRIVEGKMAGTIPPGRNLRNYEPAPVDVWPIATRPFSEAHFATFPPELVERCLKAGCPDGGRVLDPFSGAGTTGLVADAMGLDCTLIELNPDYAALAERRIAAQRMGPMSRAALKAQESEAGPLFAVSDPS